ncbi:hypothetical protein PR202_gb26059 [Eleusine coracana subsp. coracana]|uniref:Uncharacterized protein n=1 Tax=Eleusine coracana subsp. coracana TaxID=191504 RepID=A0AAV5FN29_ELECO|nr:hypothetical protein PR202_gb26059 [Eleusine coracana subsp. coracana]
MPNPAYKQWSDLDQQILSGLLSSMTEEILLDVVSATTSKEPWDIIRRMISSAIRAHTVQVRMDLVSTKILCPRINLRRLPPHLCLVPCVNSRSHHPRP